MRNRFDRSDGTYQKGSRYVVLADLLERYAKLDLVQSARIRRPRRGVAARGDHVAEGRGPPVHPGRPAAHLTHKPPVAPALCDRSPPSATAVSLPTHA